MLVTNFRKTRYDIHKIRIFWISAHEKKNSACRKKIPLAEKNSLAEKKFCWRKQKFL